MGSLNAFVHINTSEGGGISCQAFRTVWERLTSEGTRKIDTLLFGDVAVVLFSFTFIHITMNSK